MTKSDVNFDKPLRGRIYDNILETIGNTPLVRIPTLAKETKAVADVVVKCEFFNPLASVKDRIRLVSWLTGQSSLSPSQRKHRQWC